MSKDILSEEDKDLFRSFTKDVKPLHQKMRESNTPKIKKPIKNIPENKVPIKSYFLSDYVKETVYSETTLSYSIPGLSLKQLQSLKKGLIHIEAKLDLHGCNIEEASEKLSGFIQTQVQMNKKCVLIIHGKGGQQGQPPVIKNQVNCWLPQIDEVLAFHSALPKDGGMGAVYVLLKRGMK